MEMIAYNNYVLPNPDKIKLKEQGFHYNRSMSDSECDFYSLKFPVLQYLKSTTVEGEIIIDMNSGEIRVNAYNYGTKGCYTPFYRTKCDSVYKTIIQKINKVFKNMFSKVGIERAGD